MALLLILLMLVVQPSDLQAASASDLGSDYDWSPSPITKHPPVHVNQIKQGGVQAELPKEGNLHVVYGLSSWEDSVLDTHNTHNEDSIQQQQQQQPLHPPQQQHQQEDLPHEHSYDTNSYYSSHYSTNEIQTEHRRPSRPVVKQQQQISDKTWNVPAPYIKPADNLIEDVSFNIGIILVVFTLFVLSLGAIAGALTTKRTGGRSLVDTDLADLAQDVLGGIQMLENQFND